MSDDDLVVVRGLRIPRSELQVRFAPSGGPGGQHANKSATRVELTWSVSDSAAGADALRAEIIERAGPVIRVVVDDERSQLRNRAIAEERLVGRLQALLHRDAPRRPTRPSRRAVARRLDAKRQRAGTKANRRRPDADG